MSLLADSGLLTPGVQYGALSILSAVIVAGVGLFKMIYPRQEARIDALITAQAEKDERTIKVLSDSAVMVSRTVELGQRFLEANAVMEARDRERGRQAGR